MKITFTFIVCILLTMGSPAMVQATLYGPYMGEVDSTNKTKAPPIEAIVGSWEFLQDKSVLKLSIPDSEVRNMPEALLSDLMVGVFSQDESFSFPEDISQLLGSHKPLVIKAGKYPAVYEKTRYIVTFDLN
ncbi:MAG: hypothetical protein H0X33_08840 [Taibaiella sp.]|nr:hypothetical protein [Taibaiella sp.]